MLSGSFLSLTGLDSATSLGLIVTLKNLAQSGHTVVTTIHQPSSSMFAMLDNVLLLAEGGWVVYHGPTSQVVDYFASLGLYSPPHYNPADFMCTYPIAAPFHQFILIFSSSIK